MVTPSIGTRLRAAMTEQGSSYTKLIAAAAERTALNLLGHLSGIATATRELVAAVRPYAARIVFCCDAFNAMTTTRSYRAAMSTEEARTELIQNRGTQFDPNVVDATLAVVAAA